MFLSRIRATTQTLRFRLMMWNASVVILTALATLFVLREGIRVALLAETDQVLVADMQEVQLALHERSLEQVFHDLNIKAQAHELNGWYARAIDETGRQVLVTDGAPEKTRLTPEAPDFTPINKGNYRVVQYQFKRPGHSAMTIRIGSSLSRIQDDMRRIDGKFAVASGLVLFIAPLCGFWLALRATRPLQDIVHTMLRLRPTNLEERLRIRGTGDELDQLSHAFNRLLDRLGAYLEQKRDFLANAAHELRSPIAAIRSTAEVSLGASRTRQEYEDLICAVIDECSALETLVNQLLLLAETESGAIQFDSEPVNLEEVVRRTHNMFEPVAEFKGIELVTNCSSALKVVGNVHHLRQVVNNLVDNAIKFTPSGGRVSLELFEDVDRKTASLRVIDSGVGIRRDELPHVFERFFRSDRSRPRDGETRGTGLGLSICHSIVHAHGGQITVASEGKNGLGTCFTVSLPLVTDPEPST